MATYVMGDIQGCYIPLRELLDLIEFDSGKDILWVAGDMVNRGPASLSTLRFLKNLGDSCIAVLGNHDFHLLASAIGVRKCKKKDTLSAVLEASDSDELLYWLCHRKIMHYDQQRESLMVHAGIPPHWTLDQAQQYAEQIENILKDETLFREQFAAFYQTPELVPIADAEPSLAALLTYFTAMRYCNHDGVLELDAKGDEAPEGYLPWFKHEHKLPKALTIYFGHWAALKGETGDEKRIAMDTGCVWGCHLSVVRLEDGRKFSTSCAGR